MSAVHQRGLMVPVAVDDLFRDLAGNPAGAVLKFKRLGGKVKHLHRFISNLIRPTPTKRGLMGTTVCCPYLGQLTLLEQGDHEIWLVDSEDFVSCFNMF